MSTPSLSIAILNGQIKAAAFRRGTMTGTWDGPQALVDFAGLTPVLREATAKTRSNGKAVSVVVADPRLSDQFVDVPEIRGGTLRRLLERQAQRLKAFPEPAVWSAQPSMPSKNGKTILLHLCPTSLLGQISRSCQAADLQLVRLLPTTAVLIAHLKALPLQKDEIALLAAETGRSTTIVIGRKDGRICLGRVLPHTWNTAPEKVAVDLTRSIGFAEQQSGLAVTSVWLFGENVETQLPVVASVVKIPIKVSPVPYSPFYWAEQAAKLPEKEDGNLVSPEMREAPRRQRFMTVTAALVALLMFAGLAVTGVIEFIRKNELDGIAEVERQTRELSAQKTELELELAQLDRMRNLAELVEGELPPAPAWLLSYLGQVMPEELAVTRLRVARTNDFWSVHMNGTVEASTNIVHTLNSLSNNLANSGFRMAISHCGLGGITTSSPAVNPHLARAVAPSVDSKDLTTFTITGVMQ